MNDIIAKARSHCGKLLVVLALLLTCNAKADYTVVITYMRTGDPIDDDHAQKALQYTVAQLDKAGAPSGYRYVYKEFDTFVQAFQWADFPPPGVNRVAMAAHGVYIANQGYAHTLKDTTNNATPEGEVDRHFTDSYHCAEHTVDNDAIGMDQARQHLHPYRKSDGTVYYPQGTSASNYNGYGGGSGYQGYWQTISCEGQYDYFDASGAMHIVAYSYSVTVWIPQQPLGGKYYEVQWIPTRLYAYREVC